MDYYKIGQPICEKYGRQPFYDKEAKGTRRGGIF